MSQFGPSEPYGTTVPPQPQVVVISWERSLVSFLNACTGLVQTIQAVVKKEYDLA